MTRMECVEAMHKYADMVMRIALNYCKNKYDAEDIAQNVFLKLVKVADVPSEKKEKTIRFNDEEHLKRWLIRVTINECHSMFIAPWKKRTDYLEDLDITDNSYIVQEKSHLYDIVMKLPKKYLVPIYLHYYEGYSSKEISEILSVKEATIRAHLMRGRKVLKTKLEEENI